MELSDSNEYFMLLSSVMVNSLKLTNSRKCECELVTYFNAVRHFIVKQRMIGLGQCVSILAQGVRRALADLVQCEVGVQRGH